MFIIRGKFYEVWYFLIIFAVLLNVFYLPYSIAYEYDYADIGILIEIISVLIYGLDMYVSSKTVKFDTNTG